MVNDSKINIKNSICNISTFLYFLIYEVDQCGSKTLKHEFLRGQIDQLQFCKF